MQARRAARGLSGSPRRHHRPAHSSAAAAWKAQWRTPALDAAIKASTALWLEIQTSDDKSATAAIIQKLGLDPANPLAGKLSPKQNEKLSAVIAQYAFPADRLAPMRPWLAGLTIGMLPLAKAGLDPPSG